MRRIIAIVVFITFVIAVYTFKGNIDDKIDDYYFRDEFNTIDRDFWYVGEWKTLFSAYDKVDIRNGILNLEIKEIDRGPFLLSEPINLNNGDILTVTRRVKMEYANENFTGGFALLETEDKGLIPSGLNDSFGDLGNGIILIEYAHNYDENSIRPGNNVFRVLPRTWENDGNYQLLDPIYDKWFEEEIIYDTNKEMIYYRRNNEEVSVLSQEMTYENIRLFIHGYGYGTGHKVELDWVEISIERGELEEEVTDQ